MKSYLRHSKDRRVRGSANGTATVCVSSQRGKNLFTDDFFLSDLLQNYKSPLHTIYFLPHDTEVFSGVPHLKSDQLLITVLPK